jgi:hypothetical protein
MTDKEEGRKKLRIPIMSPNKHLNKMIRKTICLIQAKKIEFTAG